MSKTRDIAEARQKKEQKAAKDAPEEHKITLQEVFNEYVEVLNFSGITKLPKFPFPLRLVSPSEGMKVAHLEEENQVVRPINDSYMAELLTKYQRTFLLGMHPMFQLMPKQQDLLIEYWKRAAAELIKPVDTLWADEPGYTYSRLPWVRQVGLCPTWDEMVERMGPNGGAFMAFIGSIFVPDSYCQQYLYIYGEGGDGKGSLSRFLKAALGMAFAGKRVPANNDKFWAFNLLGKRVINFSEASAADFLQSDFFKMLVGGDAIPMEKKWGDSFDAIMKLKVIFSSNTRPVLSSQKANTRRIIYVEMPLTVKTFDHSYEDRLWAEGGAFLSKCLEVYAAKCPDHGPIPVDSAALDTRISSLEQEYEIFAETYFDFYPDDPELPLAEKPYTEPRDMHQRVKYAFPDKRVHDRVYQYLERRFRVKYVQARLPTCRPYRYVNCTVKEMGFPPCPVT